MTNMTPDELTACSVCGVSPAVNVEGTYWLCGPCVFAGIQDKMKLEQAVRELAAIRLHIVSDSISDETKQVLERLK